MKPLHAKRISFCSPEWSLDHSFIPSWMSLSFPPLVAKVQNVPKRGPLSENSFIYHPHLQSPPLKGATSCSSSDYKELLWWTGWGQILTAREGDRRGETGHLKRRWEWQLDMCFNQTSVCCWKGTLCVRDALLRKGVRRNSSVTNLRSMFLMLAEHTGHLLGVAL